MCSLLVHHQHILSVNEYWNMKEFFEKTMNKSDGETVSLAHNEICSCTMCMKSKIPLESTRKHLHGLQSTMVDRRNPDVHGSKALMKSIEALAILKAGTEINMSLAAGIKGDIPTPAGIKIVAPHEITIRATWKNKYEERAISGRDASVFGGLGVLLIPTDIETVTIPKMNARFVPREFLNKYGAELIPLEQSFILDAVSEPSLENLYLIEYQWDSTYIEDYVMKKKGGGGLFVETHPFPHVFTPLSPICSGALILGVKRSEGLYDFAAFEIPFGFTMKIKSNVIHGDSFFVGPYAIALTETELADSVIIKKSNSERDIEIVIQTSVPVYDIAALESDSFKPTHRKMLIDKIQHESTFNNNVRFFRLLPSNLLSEIRHLSSSSQKAYDEKFGLIPYTPK